MCASGQVSTWKKCLIDGAAQLFESGRAKTIDEAALGTFNSSDRLIYISLLIRVISISK
jgi:hypothetical protein